MKINYRMPIVEIMNTHWDEEIGNVLRAASCSTQKEGSFALFQKLIQLKHNSPLEFGRIQFHITCSRYCSHQLVRHRTLQFVQESTRYVKYKEGIWLCLMDIPSVEYITNVEYQMNMYLEELEQGYSTDEARKWLPSSIETELAVTGNFWAWRLFLEKRLSKHASPEIRYVAGQIKEIIGQGIPGLVEDL